MQSLRVLWAFRLVKNHSGTGLFLLFWTLTRAGFTRRAFWGIIVGEMMLECVFVCLCLGRSSVRTWGLLGCVSAECCWRPRVALREFSSVQFRNFYRPQRAIHMCQPLTSSCNVHFFLNSSGTTAKSSKSNTRYSDDKKKKNMLQIPYWRSKLPSEFNYLMTEGTKEWDKRFVFGEAVWKWKESAETLTAASLAAPATEKEGPPLLDSSDFPTGFDYAWHFIFISHRQTIEPTNKWKR